MTMPPGALAAHAGICAGGSGVTCPPTATIRVCGRKHRISVVAAIHSRRREEPVEGLLPI